MYTSKNILLRLKAYFGSTYLSEYGFPTVKILKSQYRPTLMDQLLKVYMMMVITKNVTFSMLAYDMLCQVSHYILTFDCIKKFLNVYLFC